MASFIWVFAIGDSQWVDMGTRTIDGDIVYWSASDFICSNRYSKGYSFAEVGEMGSTVGLGDITGQKKSTDLSDYGGFNCPKVIAGNSNYDIVTAFMGSPYRLPTIYDVRELMDNVTQSIKVIGKRKVTPYGAPDWVQGQWLWNDAMLINGSAANVSVSVKFDGHLASVITSDGDQWEGAWSYSKGEIHVWRLTLSVVHSEKVLRDEKGYTYKKVSNQSSSGDIKVVVLTSKINGNQLYIPLPTDFSTGTSYDGGYVIAYHNEQTHDYWSGETKSDSKGLVYNSDGAYEDYRYSHHFIRAIKVDIGSGQREKNNLLVKMQGLIGQCNSIIVQNISVSKQLMRKDSNHDYRKKASKSIEFNNSKTLVIDKKKSKNELEAQIKELENMLKELREESIKLNTIIEKKRLNAQECTKTVFGDLLSITFDKTLFEYRVSAINLNNGKAEILIYVFENKNADKFRKFLWEKIEKTANYISREELSKKILTKMDPGYQVDIKGDCAHGNFYRYHFEKSKEQKFTYQINKKSLYNYLDLSEIASVVNDSIRKAMADFSIIDAQGHSYSFTYDPSFSAEKLDVFYLDSINYFIPLFRYRGDDFSAIDRKRIENVSSVSDGYYQWINPFLVNDEKNKELFVCRLILPYSESYLFSSIGHEQIKLKPLKKHSVNPKPSYRALFGERMLNQLIENERDNGYRSQSSSRSSFGTYRYYNSYGD